MRELRVFNQDTGEEDVFQVPTAMYALNDGIPYERLHLDSVRREITNRMTQQRGANETPFTLRNIDEREANIENNKYTIKIEIDFIFIRNQRGNNPPVEIDTLEQFNTRAASILDIIRDVVYSIARAPAEVALARGPVIPGPVKEGERRMRQEPELPEGIARNIQRFLTGETPRERSRRGRGRTKKSLRRRRRTLRK